MPILDAQHDFAHPVEGDTAWSESYYFNSYCPVVDAGFYTRIGVRPNEGTIDVGMHVWLPGQDLAQAGGVREQKEMIDSGLTVAGVTYERIEPLQQWRITADSDAIVRDLDGGLDALRGTHIAIDVTFDALTPAIGVDGQGRENKGAGASTATTVGKGHLEQAGTWTGYIEADGVRHTLVDARGNRDKSWGPRRWGGPKMWRWFSINIGDDVHFGGIRIGTEVGDLHRGWVWKDGEHSSITDWDVKTEVADDGVTHRVSYVRATDKLGRVHELQADVLRVAPGPAGVKPNTTIVNEGLARWTYEGQTGHGIAEYLHQLDADARPVVPIE
ncbi:MAG: hypothetical protein SGJ13_05220 [Actinomycetota bacterium]|nr:hypothetical protein [Actinomycetota bacterium]